MSTYTLRKFREAVRCLPGGVAELCYALPEKLQTEAEELRLRTGRQATVLLPDGEHSIGARKITPQDLEETLERATGASVHSASESIRAGYVTVSGGHRLGICGTAAVKDGAVIGFRGISSLNLRVAKEIKGAAEKAVPRLNGENGFCSTLIIAPPGRGKTTFLRDTVRILSNGGMRCCVADERGEIAACLMGTPQLDVGEHTDVMDAAPRSVAVMMLLRSMDPQLIAIDEITEQADAKALLSSANCGVKLIATAHAGSIEELWKRAVYRELLEAGIFERFVFISGRGRAREYTVSKGVRDAENNRRDNGDHSGACFGSGRNTEAQSESEKPFSAYIGA